MCEHPELNIWRYPVYFHLWIELLKTTLRVTVSSNGQIGFAMVWLFNQNAIIARRDEHLCCIRIKHCKLIKNSPWYRDFGALVDLTYIPPAWWVYGFVRSIPSIRLKNEHLRPLCFTVRAIVILCFWVNEIIVIVHRAARARDGHIRCLSESLRPVIDGWPQQWGCPAWAECALK